LIVSDGSQIASKDSITIDTNETKPQLIKFEDQKILVGENALLDGSEIYDPDGDNIAFHWELMQKPSDSQALIENPYSENPIVTTDVRGKYSFRLKVSDTKHVINSNLFQVYAVDFFDRSNRALGCVLDRIFFDGFDGLFTNSPPVADVGPDKTGVIGQNIVLDGSLSNDIDLDTLTYSWSLLTSPTGSSATITNNNEMIAGLLPDVEGDYVAQLIVNDGCLDSDPDSALVTISVNQSPEIISTPITSIGESQSYSYQVVANDPEGHELEYELTVSPAGSTIDINGLMTWTSLGEGAYPVTILVTDEYGASDSQSYDLIVTANRAPIIQSFPLSSAEQDYNYSYQVIASDADGDSISYQLINPVAGMTIDSNGLITWTPDSAGSFQVEIEVNDGVGGSDSQTFALEVVQLPPNPVDIAPPLSRTDFPPFIETINFLYDAIPAVQVDLDVNSIQDYRVAVLKGRALGADGNPLAGVKVTIRNHPEFGYTYTREDGLYDLVVNGGGTLTVNFEKGGYLPVQRDIRTPWEDYAYSEDVVLIRLDDKVSSIDLLDTSNDFQVAQGSVVTDEDGTRQATLLFPSGIGATMQLSDGSSQSLLEINVRATEYTVGDLGVKRMPGELPAATGYTYAAELSIDDAIINNAVRVDFDQPIPFYVDNFLNFPQGEPVPVGYYDREKAVWVPIPNGRVIKVLSIVNNSAILDVTDDGIDNEATQAELDQLNITSAELIQIGLLYSEGKTLWRTLITHFTPFDCNWPFGPPEDIQEPPEEPPFPESPENEEDDSPEDEPEEDDDDWECDGCIINVNSRILKEVVPIVGTNYNLNYRTGNNLNDTIEVDSYQIPLTHSVVDPLLKRIELIVFNYTIGGASVYSFQPSDGLSHTVNWDGKDPYGRFTHSANVSYLIKYFYDAVYISPRDERERSFSTYWDRGVEVYPSRGNTEVFLEKHNRFNLYRHYTSGSTTKTSKNSNKLEIEPFKSIREEQLNLGGWSFENHHIYNPNNNVLYMGDGFKRDVTSVEGQVQNSDGNGVSALNTSLNETKEIAESPDGSIYFHDDNLGQIRKITSDGTILRVAGKLHISPPYPYCNGIEPVEGESQFALCLRDIDALEIADNGDIYFSYDRRIRKINRDGQVFTVVGSGEYGYSPDGTPALLSKISAIDLKFSKDGVLYFLENNGLLRFINNDGNIETLAGGGNPGGPGGPIDFDGILASETWFSQPTGFALSDDGSIVIADTYHECVRHITTDGYIYTMPSSSPCIEYGDEKEKGGYEIQSLPIKVNFDSQGNVVYLDSYDPNYPEPRTKFVKINYYGLHETLNSNPAGFSGDGGDFSNAELNYPSNFLIDTDGRLIIADSSNTRIRKVRGDNSIITIAGGGTSTKNTNQRNNLKIKNFSKGIKTNKFITERDGSVIYEFTSKGVHMRTLDAITAKVLVSFNYDSDGILSSIVDDNGLLTTLIRNANDELIDIVSPYGKTTELSYFTNGLLKQVKDPLNNHWDFEYLNGNLSAFTDRNSNRYEYTYNSDGLLETDLNPIGGGWQLSDVNDVEGSSTVTMTSAEGRVYEFFKDKTENGHAKTYRTTLPDGTEKYKEITYSDDYFLNSDGSEYFVGHEGTDRLGSHIKFVSDELIKVPSGLQMTISNDLTETTSDPNVIAPVLQSTKTTNINSYDWVSQFDLNIGDSGGFMYTTPMGRSALTLLDANKRIKSTNVTGFESINYGYDSDGRIESIHTGQGPDKRETTITYYTNGTMNGEIHTVTNALGHVISFEYDKNGRIIKQTLPDLREISFSYDANANLKTYTPAGKPTHGFNYNGLNMEVQYTPPSIVDIATPATNYEYNYDQQITKALRPDGQQIDFNYNSNTGKLESKIVLNGVYTYSYFYELDSDGNQTGSGRLKKVTSPAGISLNYTYDGFLTSSIAWSGSIAGSVSFSYDNLFRITSYTINGTDTIIYGYDNDNLITTTGQLVINRKNQMGGLIDNTQLGNITTSNTYSAFQELLTYNAKYNDLDIFDISIVRDKLGRVVKKTKAIGSEVTVYEYGYDVTGRLVEEKTNNIVTSSWGYDDNGNRTHLNGDVVASFDNQDRLITHNNNTYTYSDHGDLLTKTTGSEVTSYNYDVLGNLLSVTLPDNTLIEYLIDSQGRRVGKKINGVLVKGWLYKDKLNPIAELNSNGDVVKRFVFGDSAIVPSYIIQNEINYSVITNEMGSPVMIIDSNSGNIIQELSYDAWGNVLSDSNPGFQPFGFVGGLYDPDTKLVRFGYRDYDGTIGRWTNKDLIKIKGGDTNLYSYVSNDPINLIDIFGLETCVLVTRNGVGFGTHAALYTSRGGDKGDPTLYDPSGSYAPTIDTGNGDLVNGSDADISKFAEFHEKLDGSSLDVVCQNTSAQSERDFFEKALELGPGFGPQCAIKVSSVIGGSSSFPDVEPGTFFPGNLYDDAGGN